MATCTPPNLTVSFWCGCFCASQFLPCFPDASPGTNRRCSRSTCTRISSLAHPFTYRKLDMSNTAFDPSRDVQTSPRPEKRSCSSRPNSPLCKRSSCFPLPSSRRGSESTKCFLLEGRMSTVVDGNLLVSTCLICHYRALFAIWF